MTQQTKMFRSPLHTGNADKLETDSGSSSLESQASLDSQDHELPPPSQCSRDTTQCSKATTQSSKGSSQCSTGTSQCSKGISQCSKGISQSSKGTISDTGDTRATQIDSHKTEHHGVTEQKRSDSLINKISFGASAQGENETSLPVDDLPQLTKRPNYGVNYRSYLDNNTIIQYDADQRCFVNTIKLPTNINDYWFLAQLKSLEIEPGIAYEKFGFKFGDDRIADTISALENECEKLEVTERDYMMVKIKSIKALYFIHTARHLEGHKLLTDLEKSVVYMEQCDLTAWFYVANFFARLKDMNSMRYTGAIRHHYKTQCVSHLQKARSSFLAAGKRFAVPAALTLWWQGLIHADVTKMLMDDLHQDPILNLKQHSFDNLISSERNHANDCLHKFREESKLLAEFSEPDKQQSCLLTLLKMLETLTETSDTVSAAGAIQEADEVILKRLYFDFVSRIRGKTRPKCIHQIMRNKKEGKIYIITSDEESTELFTFLNEHQANTTYFAIRKGQRSELLNHPVKEIRENFVRDHISPGSVLIGFPQEYCKENEITEDYDELLKLPNLEWATLGCFVTDDNGKILANQKGLSAAHPWRKHATANSKGKPLVQNLTFFSVHSEKSHGVNKEHRQETVIDKVKEMSSSGCLGYYGPYEGEAHDEAWPFLIDALIFDVDDNFDEIPYVDMILKSPKARNPFNLEIYSGILGELFEATVSMYGVVSGKCLGQGTIVATNVEGIEMEGVSELVSGLLAVDMNFKVHKPLVARKGDSGAVIFAWIKDKYYAIALVLGRNPEIINGDNGETYEFVTLCTPLKHIKEYFKEHGIDISIYNGHNANLMQAAAAAAYPGEAISPDSSQRVTHRDAKPGDSGYTTVSSDYAGQLDANAKENVVPLSSDAGKVQDDKQHKPGGKRELQRMLSMISTSDTYDSQLPGTSSSTDLACPKEVSEKSVDEGGIIKKKGPEIETFVDEDGIGAQKDSDIHPLGTSQQSSFSSSSDGGYEGCDESNIDNTVSGTAQLMWKQLHAFEMTCKSTATRMKALPSKSMDDLSLGDVPSSVEQPHRGSPRTSSPYDSDACKNLSGLASEDENDLDG